MFFKKRATRATKHINPLPSTGFMRSTSFFVCYIVCYKNAECVAGHWIYAQHETCYIFQLLYFQMLITSIITFSMYAVSRTIQNPSFNMPYDVTTRIKYQFCKIIRVSLKSSLYTIFWCYTAIRKKIIPTRFRVGILFTY